MAVGAILLVIYLIITLFIFLEYSHERFIKSSITSRKLQISLSDTSKIISVCWLLTAIPVAALFMLIGSAGGVAEYINQIALRVEEWEGKGIYVAAVKMMPVLNLIYFSTLFAVKANRKAWLKYAAHFILFVLCALATGSRNTLVLNFLLMLFVIAHLGYLPTKRILISAGGACVLLVLVLGAYRNTVKLDEGAFTVSASQSDSSFDLQAIHYVPVPLEVMTSQNHIELEYGFTYLSLITNFVPRSIWPEKFDTGGLIYTKKYLDNKWDGTSFASPGVFGEAMMNFGVIVGIFWGIFFVVLNFFALNKIYMNAMAEQVVSKKYLLKIITVGYFMFAVSNLFFAEFTTNYFNFLQRIIIAFLVFFLARLVFYKR